MFDVRYYLLFVLFFSGILTGCGDSSSDSTNTNFSETTSTTTLNLQCDLTASYTPVTTPELSSATGASVATIIAVHGKNGSPLRAHMQTLKTDLNTQDYDVIMPYMPWSDLTWSGTLCDSISYLNSLISTEKSAGKPVILLGHSLAGPVVLAYSVLENSTKPDAISIIAPGHFIHQSSVLDNAHASSITLANSMISSDQSDQFATFETYNNGAPVSISATPVAYLSMHDTDQFPNIETSIPLISQPVLWLAGLSDPLTASATSFGFIDLIPSSSSNIYKELTGDHYSVMDNVAGELDPWFQGL